MASPPPKLNRGLSWSMCTDTVSSSINYCSEPSTIPRKLSIQLAAAIELLHRPVKASMSAHASLQRGISTRHRRSVEPSCAQRSLTASRPCQCAVLARSATVEPRTACRAASGSAACASAPVEDPLSAPLPSQASRREIDKGGGVFEGECFERACTSEEAFCVSSSSEVLQALGPGVGTPYATNAAAAAARPCS